MGQIWYGEIKWKRLERRKSTTVFKHLCSEVSRHLRKYLLHRNPHILNPARFLSHRSHLFPGSKHKMLISISTTEVMPVSPRWFIFQLTKKIKKRSHQHPKGPLSLRNPAKSNSELCYQLQCCCPFKTVLSNGRKYYTELLHLATENKYWFLPILTKTNKKKPLFVEKTQTILDFCLK